MRPSPYLRRVGVRDFPCEACSDLAYRKGLWLHVDAAFGGSILPFMRDLGHPIEPFDFSLPGVSSMMTDGHKLGLMPVATGFFLVREPAMFDAIPTDLTLIHTTSSTKPGSRAASAWAVMQHLGREGYQRSTAHVLELAGTIATGVTEIPGIDLIVPPFISIVAFTSKMVDLLRCPSAAGRGRLGPKLRRASRQAVHPPVDPSFAPHGARPGVRPRLCRGHDKGAPPLRYRARFATCV